MVIESTSCKESFEYKEDLEFALRELRQNILRSPPYPSQIVYKNPTSTPPRMTTIVTPTTPSTPKHDYTDPTVFYVCRDYFAPSDDHLSVFIDDELEIIEEILGGALTRVRERDSQQSGLIPTDIIESGSERLAKANKSTNQDTIRIMSCRSSSSVALNSSSSASSSSFSNIKKNKFKRVSFNDSDPEVLIYPSDQSNDDETISKIPFSIDFEDEFKNVLVISDPIIEETKHVNYNNDENNENNNIDVFNDKNNKPGFFKKLFTKPSTTTSTSSISDKIVKSLQSFEKYPDHLIRVYTGNFYPSLHTFKTFIVDESLSFGEFSSMVISSFNLDTDPDAYRYEINLVNHLTAELIPLDLDFSIEQVIELTKREALAFSGHMPREFRKAQKSALKRLRERQNNYSHDRDKATDYVTPFKFILNRTYTRFESVPIYIHVNLSCTELANSSGPTNLILSSIIPSDDNNLNDETKEAKKKWKWYKRFSKSKNHEVKPSPTSSSSNNHLERILLRSTDPIHTLVHNLLETLQVPETIPNIAFEASLPPVHDAVEFPLAMNISVGDALKIRPKLDQSQQVIIIRPVLV